MTAFTALLWAKPLEGLPRRVWAERVLVAFGALREHAGIERFWTIGHEHEEIPLEVAALEDLIAANQRTDDVGQLQPRLGSMFGVLCTDPGGDPARARFRVGLTVGSRAEPPLKNTLSVSFDPETGAGVARAVLEAWIPAWSPAWGCVISNANQRARREEFEATLGPEDDGLLAPIDEVLHWVTYFGPERAAELDVAAVEGRSDVVVRSLHEGVEVVLGERWESDEVLGERQRALEPLLLGARAETGA